MKSAMEQQYEKRILYHICTLDISLEHRVSLLQDFQDHREAYYDGLCDILYMVSKEYFESTIWMTETGQFYMAPCQRNGSDLSMCACSDIPPFKGDLAAQLEHIFLCIYRKMSHPQEPALIVSAL